MTPVRTDAESASRSWSWLAETVSVRPARFPVGHGIRSGLAVGGPFVVGALTDHVLTGMWIGLATLLLAAGEREGTYRLNFTIIAVSTPIAAAGYVLGFSQKIPLAALIILMAMLALLMGLLAGLGPAFSVGGMQFLLVASIAIGVDGIDWWVPLGLYFVGAALYAALLAVEMLVDPSRPQRRALEDLLLALADLARARRLHPGADDTHTADARARVVAAYSTATTRGAEFGLPGRRARGWSLDQRVTSVAERVAALLISADEPATLAAAETRLEQMAELVAGSGPSAPPPSSDADPASAVDARLDELEAAIRAPATDRPSVRGLAATPAIDSEVVLAATRLATCFGIAVAARAYFPFNHWFWIPLTVCLVMKPDFGSVFSRAILRVIGTVVGVAIATVVIWVVPDGAWYGVVMAFLAALVPWMMLRSYALQAVAIAPIVILLVATITPGDENFSWQRVAATAIGGAIVLVFGYLIWPHSRREWVTHRFAQAMDCIAVHLQLAGSKAVDDRQVAAVQHDDLLDARRSADRALAELQSRLHRALAEPGSARAVAARSKPAVDAAERLAASVTALAVHRVAGGDAPKIEETIEVAAAIRHFDRVDVHELRPTSTDLQQVVVELANVSAAVDRTHLFSVLEPSGRP